jgi:hypothetical protein
MLINFAVDCRESRFWRTPADNTTSLPMARLLVAQIAKSEAGSREPTRVIMIR